jgi:hypothetical protein
MDSVAAATSAVAAAAATGGCAATEATDLQDPDDLVCEIIELQMEMDGNGIDYTCLKIFIANIFKELPSLSPEVRVKKLRNILEMMKKKNNIMMQARVQSRESAVPDRHTQQSPHTGGQTEQTRRQSGTMDTFPGHALSAAGTKRGRKQRELHPADEQPQPLEHEDRKRPRNARISALSLRTDIEKKLEDFRAFAVPYLQRQQEAGLDVDRHALILAYKAETGVSVPLSTFANKYIIWEDLQAAVRNDDITLAPICKMRYATIEDAIADACKPRKLREAADWCVAEVKTLIGAHHALNGCFPMRLREQLIARSEGTVLISIHGQFKNCIFSIAKLLAYCNFPVAV